MQMTVNGTTYCYEVYGTGVPLVLLHGFTGSQATWFPFIEQWKTSFQLILLDLPGHGGTELNPPFSMWQCCVDLQEILNNLQLDQVHLLGYSMGGRTALSFAMYFPSRIASLILESASPGLANVDERRKRQENDHQLAEKIEKEGIELFVNEWENLPLFKTQKFLAQNDQQRIRQERLAQTPEGLAASLRYMGTGEQTSWWNQLEQLHFPVLLLVGEWDKKFRTKNQKMAQTMKQVELQTVPKAGHAAHVEQPKKFGRIIEEFISITMNRSYKKN